MSESLEAPEPFLDLPPRDPVRFIDVGGGSDALSETGMVNPAPNLSSVAETAETGVPGTVSVSPSLVVTIGVGKEPSVLLLIDRLRRVVLVGGGCSSGSSPISSNSAMPCGRSLQSPRNCNKKSRSYLSIVNTRSSV